LNEVAELQQREVNLKEIVKPFAFAILFLALVMAGLAGAVNYGSLQGKGLLAQYPEEIFSLSIVVAIAAGLALVEWVLPFVAIFLITVVKQFNTSLLPLPKGLLFLEPYNRWILAAVGATLIVTFVATIVARGVAGIRS